MRRDLGDGFELDDDPARIDAEAVHAYISGESYWGRGRTRELVEQTIARSQRVVGLYCDGRQIGFARAVSDGVTVGYLADVYVLEAYRGRGLGLELVRETIDGGQSWPVRWLLHTADAQGLYAKLGFAEGAAAYPLMERGRQAGAGARSEPPGRASGSARG
jgi:GNAT superfamily N-acetyltransferase